MGVQEQKDRFRADIRKRSAETIGEEDAVGNGTRTTTAATVRQTISALVPGLYQVPRKNVAEVKVRILNFDCRLELQPCTSSTSGTGTDPSWPVEAY